LVVFASITRSLSVYRVKEAASQIDFEIGYAAKNCVTDINPGFLPKSAHRKASLRKAAE
jgi:hypothetical protein